YVFMYPVIRPDLSEQSKAMWCSPDRSKAWLDLALRGNRPAARSACEGPVDKNLALGRGLGVHSTPTLIFVNGEPVAGGLAGRHPAIQALLRERIGAGEIHRGAERHEAPVDSEAVFRGQRNVKRADRAVGRGQFPEKHIARVVVERVLQLSGIRRGPRLDALH